MAKRVQLNVPLESPGVLTDATVRDRLTRSRAFAAIMSASNSMSYRKIHRLHTASSQEEPLLNIMSVEMNKQTQHMQFVKENWLSQNTYLHIEITYSVTDACVP